MAIDKDKVLEWAKFGNHSKITGMRNAAGVVTEEEHVSVVGTFKDFNSEHISSPDNISLYDQDEISKMKDDLKNRTKKWYGISAMPAVKSELVFLSDSPKKSFKRIFVVQEYDFEILDHLAEQAGVDSELKKVSSDDTSTKSNVTVNSFSLATPISHLNDWVFYRFDSGILAKDVSLKTLKPTPDFKFEDVVDKMLLKLSKKGNWSKSDDSLDLEHALEDTKVENSNIPGFQTELAKIFETKTDNSSSGIIYQDNNNKSKSAKNSKIVHYNIEIPKNQDATVWYTFGLPKTVLEKFPTILESELKTIKYKNSVEFFSVSQIDKFVILLEKIFAYHEDLLNKEDGTGYAPINFTPSHIVRSIKDFVVLLKRDLATDGVPEDKHFIFKFDNGVCEVGQADCVEAQTNSILMSIEYHGGDIKKKNLYQWNHKQPTDSLSNSLAAYVFLNIEQITKAPYKDMKARDYFKKYIYKKAAFKTKEPSDFPKKILLTNEESIAQDSSVRSAENVVKFSKIRKNIQNQSSKNKTAETLIRDSLRDVQNLKDLYRKIIYKFELQSIMEGLVSCILKNNPALSSALSFQKRQQDTILNFLNTGMNNVPAIKRSLSTIQCVAEGSKHPNIVASLSGYEILNNIKGAAEGLTMSDSDTKKARDEYALFYADVKKQIKGIAASKSLTQDEKDKLGATLIQCSDTFFKEDVQNFLKQYPIFKPLHDEGIATLRKIKRRNPGSGGGASPGPGSGNGPNSGAGAGTAGPPRETARELLTRNLLFTFERQAAQLIKEAIFQLIKKMLHAVLGSILRNSCNNNNAGVSSLPGDLKMNLGFSTQTGNLAQQGPISLVEKLILYLSSNMMPDELCGLFTSSALDETYDKVLQVVTNSFNALLYVDKPIVINKITVIDDGLYNQTKLKNFFVVMANEFPEKTGNVCAQYLQDKQNETLPIDPSTKCVDISALYVQKRQKSLQQQGFSKEQIDQINQDDADKIKGDLDDISKLIDDDFYEKINSESDNHVIEIPTEVKNKIDKQIDALFDNFLTNIKLFSSQIYKEYTNTDGDMILATNFVLEDKSIPSLNDSSKELLFQNQYEKSYVEPYGLPTFKLKLKNDILSNKLLTAKGNFIDQLNMSFSSPISFQNDQVIDHNIVTLENNAASLVTFQDKGIMYNTKLSKLDILKTNQGTIYSSMFAGSKSDYFLETNLGVDENSRFSSLFMKLVLIKMKPLVDLGIPQFLLSDLDKTTEFAHMLNSLLTDLRIYFNDVNSDIIKFLFEEYTTSDDSKPTENQLLLSVGPQSLNNYLFPSDGLKNMAKEFLYSQDDQV